MDCAEEGSGVDCGGLEAVVDGLDADTLTAGGVVLLCLGGGVVLGTCSPWCGVDIRSSCSSLFLAFVSVVLSSCLGWDNCVVGPLT